MQTIRVRPNGFRVVFTTPVDPDDRGRSGVVPAGALPLRVHGRYGSPELDRTTVKVESVDVSADGHRVDLTTAPLVKDRVYMMTASGVRSARRGGAGEPGGGVHGE